MIRNYAMQVLALELWVLLALSAASLFWLELLPAVVLTAAFFWLARLVGFGYLTLRTPADLAIALLCFFLVAAVFITSEPEKTIPQVWRALSGIALFYAIVNWVSTYTRIRYLFTGIILLGLLLALFAPFSVEWAVDKVTFIPAILYQKFFVLVQDFVHPNVLAGSLVLLLPFPLSYLIFGWKRIKRFERVLVLAALLLLLTMLVLTRSRGAWMAAAVSIFLLLLLRERRSWIFILLAGAGILVLIYQFGLARFLDIVVYSSSIGGWDGRLEIWVRAVNLIRDFPFTGIGMGSFQVVAKTFYPYDIYAPEFIPHAHNLFMQVSLDVGLPGMIAWLAIYITMNLLSWQIYQAGQKWKDSIYLSIGAALIASQTALAVHGLTDAVTWGMVRPAPLVWIIWGVGAAVISTLIKLQKKT